ncbi:hypothetical protein BJ742DRAFT_305641 [Cladochytrium replicatum]|nr:hypothetical protein BJ742DRAFT_305641 [Cladochytrium replicatum]
MALAPHEDLVSDGALYISELVLFGITFVIMLGNLTLVANILRRRLHTFNFLLFAVVCLFALQHLAMLGETLAVFNSGANVDTHNRFAFYQKKQLVNSLSNSDPDKPWVSVALALMKTQELTYTVAVSSYSLLFQARFRVLQDALHVPRWVFPLLMVVTVLLMVFNFVTLTTFHGEDIDIIAGTVNPAWVSILEVVMSVVTMYVIHKNKRKLHMASGSSNSLTTASGPGSSHGKSTASVNVWADQQVASQFSQTQSKSDLIGAMYTTYTPPTANQHHAYPPQNEGRFEPNMVRQHQQQAMYQQQQQQQGMYQQQGIYQQQQQYPPPPLNDNGRYPQQNSAYPGSDAGHYSDHTQSYHMRMDDHSMRGGHPHTQSHTSHVLSDTSGAKMAKAKQGKHAPSRASEDSAMQIRGLGWLFAKQSKGRAGMYFAILRSATWLSMFWRWFERLGRLLIVYVSVVFTVLGIGTYASSFAVMDGTTFNIGAVLGRAAYIFNDLYVTSAILFMGAIRKVMLK